MLAVAACEVGYPIPMFILMETDDGLFHSDVIREP